VKTPVSFYSDGVKLDGDIYTPEGRAPRERRAGIVLCHGYTGVKDIYLPDNARVLNDAGYVVMVFDYKGWGKSEGPRSRLAPYSRLADVQAALTFLGAEPNVDPERLGICIHIEVEKRRLDVEISAAEMKRPLAKWKAPRPRYTSGVFHKYAKTVSNASEGAVTG
jgi:hypothetical protein